MQTIARSTLRHMAEVSKDFWALARQARVYLWSAFAFSFAVNLLFLTPSLYMMNVYDRVLASGSEMTLAMLSLLAVLALTALGVLDDVRARVLVRASIRFDKVLGPRVLAAQIERSALLPGGGAKGQSIRDLDTVRQFLSGSGLVAFLDLPWMPIYLLITFMLSPVIGGITLLGIVLLGTLAYVGERRTQPLMSVAGEASIRNYTLTEALVANVEVVQAMGMLPALLRRWGAQRREVLGNQAEASDLAGLIACVIKWLRLVLQTAIVGVGAWLVLEQQLTGGGMYAAMILMGRALAPIEQLSGVWRQISGARDAFRRVNGLLSVTAEAAESMPLPRPAGRLDVQRVVYAPPGGDTAIIKGLSFSLNAGEFLAIIGPSGAGKSTLTRLLTGVWRPQSGNVRVDGADVFAWDRADFGQYLGYLPQDIELFAGTVRENIARFTDASPDDIIAAAKAAGLHDLILELPKGYETQIGEAGTVLSGGQRQRIGLARALFGNPSVLVLDEPNSNLDAFGEEALGRALAQAKAKGTTIIVVSHRNGILGLADKMLYLKAGQAELFGPRDQVLARLQASVPALASTSTGQPLASITAGGQ